MKTIGFKVQGKVIMFEDTDHIIQRLREDDDYAYDYITQAIQTKKLEACGIIASDSDEIEICRILTKHNKEDDFIKVDYSSNPAAPFETDLGSYMATDDPDQEDVSGEAVHIKEDGSKDTWTPETTKLMLTHYQDVIHEVGRTVKFKNKKAMWRYISEEMAKQGYTFTAVQVENRHKTLERGSKKKNVNTKRTSSLFERELSEIQREAKQNILDLLLASTDKTDSILFDHNSLQIDPLKRKLKRQLSLSEKLKRIKELTDEDTEKQETRFFKRRALELEEAKLEAYKERTKVIERKVFVLETLISKIK